MSAVFKSTGTTIFSVLSLGVPLKKDDTLSAIEHELNENIHKAIVEINNNFLVFTLLTLLFKTII